MNSMMRAVHLQIFFLPVIFSTAAAQDKSEFKPSGKLSGQVFSDYYYKVHADSMNRGTGEYSNSKEGANAFEFRRVYLGYDYSISETFSAELLLSHEKNYDASGNRAFFIKAANLRWKNFLPRNDLIVGQTATPTWSLLTEKIWSYRSVEKTILDFHKGGNSNDAGISLHGRIDSAGNFGYNFMAGNGTAAKVENNIFKKFYGELYAKFFGQRMIIDLYSDFERLQLSPVRQERTTYKAFLAYKSKKITVGTEAYYQFFIVPNFPASEVTYSGIALFAKTSLLKEKVVFFIRNDIYTLSPALSTLYRSSENFSLVGVDYMPHPNVHIIPNVWMNSYNNDDPLVPAKHRRGYDLVTRVTVFYSFR